jgi:acetylornithine deacetylase/succinyl-diaminopimelate desuccinylase-like protein
MKADSDSARTYCLNLLGRLVDIPSVFPEEEEITLFLEREYASMGLKPQRIDVAPRRFNILCSIGSGSPRLCLNAHADTVPPNGESVPKARIDGDMLHGLGSCDTKASIASMTAAFLDLAADAGNLTGVVDLLISVDEEGDGIGVRTAVSKGYKCDYAIVGEPTDLNVICAHNGLLFLKLTTIGKSAHGCHPTLGISAVERMMSLVEDIRAQLGGFCGHILTGEPSLNLGEIHAGDRPNRVPDHCVARIDIRFAPPATNAQVLEVATAVIDSHDWASYEVEKRGETLDTPVDSPLIAAIRDSARGLGRESRIGGLRGWTEAEPFRTMLGIDSVVLGPGCIKQAHTSREFVSISETQLAAAFYADIARRLLSV